MPWRPCKVDLLALAYQERRHLAPAMKTQMIAGALVESPTKSILPLRRSFPSPLRTSPMDLSDIDLLKTLDEQAADLAPPRLEILRLVVNLTRQLENVLAAAHLRGDHLHLVANEKDHLHVQTISTSIVVGQGSTIINESRIVANLLAEKIAETAVLQEGRKGLDHLGEASEEATIALHLRVATVSAARISTESLQLQRLLVLFLATSASKEEIEPRSSTMSPDSSALPFNRTTSRRKNLLTWPTS